MKVDIKGIIVPNDYGMIYDWFGLENTSPGKVAKAIAQAEKSGEALDVEINSGGGYIFAGNEIYTQLRNYKGNCNIRIIWAASAASVIAMARHSVIEPTGMMMIHNVQGSADGDYLDMAHESDVLHKASTALSTAYQIKTGKSEAEIMELMDKETWFTASEAKDLGFVDEIADAPAMVAAYRVPVLSQKIIDMAKKEMADYDSACEKFKGLGGST